MIRIYHHWQYWECVKHGMYCTTSPVQEDEARNMYAAFLSDTPRFKSALTRVCMEWPISCEQFLTNDSINRIAWLGQASLCIETGLPRIFRAGFKLLSPKDQRKANMTAEHALTRWIKRHPYHEPLLESLPVPRFSSNGCIQNKINHYIHTWKHRGYEHDIPDDIPGGLMHDNLVPAYKKIAHAILKNDHTLQSLGLTAKVSPWYSAIKRNEIAERESYASTN